MGKKLLGYGLLIGALALCSWWMAKEIQGWRSQDQPDPEASPIPVENLVEETIDSAPEVTITSTTAAPLSSTEPTSTTTTSPPPPDGGAEEIVCGLPNELWLYLATEDMLIKAPVDVSDSRFNPAKNRVDIHTSSVNGLPCANTTLPVKLLGHKQHQFCNLVIEPEDDACRYGVNLKDKAWIVLDDGIRVVEYEVVEPLVSKVAEPLKARDDETPPTPGVIFDKYNEFLEFYDEVFPREDAADEMWLFTSCSPLANGHSPDACAVRTEFVRMTTVEQVLLELGVSS